MDSTSLQMIFEAGKTKPIPRAPRDKNGKVRTPNGRRLLGVGQMIDRYGVVAGHRALQEWVSACKPTLDKGHYRTVFDSLPVNLRAFVPEVAIDEDEYETRAIERDGKPVDDRHAQVYRCQSHEEAARKAAENVCSGEGACVIETTASDGATMKFAIRVDLTVETFVTAINGEACCLSDGVPNDLCNHPVASKVAWAMDALSHLRRAGYIGSSLNTLDGVVDRNFLETTNEANRLLLEIISTLVSYASASHPSPTDWMQGMRRMPEARRASNAT
jgi:hypothetical protein